MREYFILLRYIIFIWSTSIFVKMPTIFQIAVKTDTVSLHERKRGREGRREEEREREKERKRERREKEREGEINKGKHV